MLSMGGHWYEAAVLKACVEMEMEMEMAVVDRLAGPTYCNKRLLLPVGFS